MAIHMALGLYYFLALDLSQLIKGNYDPQPIGELNMDTTSIDLLTFVYQNGSSAKTDILIKREHKAQAQESLLITDFQHDKRSPSIPKAGSLAEWRDVIGLNANIICVIETLMKPTKKDVSLTTIIISCFCYIFSISMNQIG